MMVNLKLFRQELIIERDRIVDDRLGDAKAGTPDIGFALSELRVLDGIIAALDRAVERSLTPHTPEVLP
jgi:hypothetical protein